MSSHNAVTLESTVGNPYLEKYQQEMDLIGPLNEYGFPLFDSGGDMEQSVFRDARATRSRRQLATYYAWAVPSAEAINVLVRESPLIEMGAGAGYWAKLVTEAGGDVVAYDQRPVGYLENGYCSDVTWYNVQNGSVEQLGNYPERALFLCWPSHNTPFASDCLKHYRGDTLVYVGESDHGCCANDEFFEILERDWTEEFQMTIPQWPGIRDDLRIYRKNAL